MSSRQSRSRSLNPNPSRLSNTPAIVVNKASKEQSKKSLAKSVERGGDRLTVSPPSRSSVVRQRSTTPEPRVRKSRSKRISSGSPKSILSDRNVRFPTGKSMTRSKDHVPAYSASSRKSVSSKREDKQGPYRSMSTPARQGSRASTASTRSSYDRGQEKQTNLPNRSPPTLSPLAQPAATNKLQRNASQISQISNASTIPRSSSRLSSVRSNMSTISELEIDFPNTALPSVLVNYPNLARRRDSNLRVDRLSLREIVDAYVKQKIVIYCGLYGARDLNLSTALRLLDHPVLVAMQKTEDSYRKNAGASAMLSQMSKKVVGGTCDASQAHSNNNKLRNLYVNNIHNNILADYKLLEHTEYDWTVVTMVVAATAEMAAEAVRICYIEKVETLLELCCAFIKAWNINHWVDSKGGWESITADDGDKSTK